MITEIFGAECVIEQSNCSRMGGYDSWAITTPTGITGITGYVIYRDPDGTFYRDPMEALRFLVEGIPPPNMTIEWTGEDWQLINGEKRSRVDDAGFLESRARELPSYLPYQPNLQR